MRSRFEAPSNVVRMPDRNDLVGIQEIANVTGQSPQAVCNWTVRYADFPKPVAVLKMGRIWNIRDVAEWAWRHGRDA